MSVGMGKDASGNLYNDFYEYSPGSGTTDAWAVKQPYAGTSRWNAAGFVIGNKVYVGTGSPTGSYSNGVLEFYQYNTSTNVWAKKTDYTFTPGNHVAQYGFAIGTEGYLGGGFHYASGFLGYDSTRE